jgi:hypothetical protein
VLGFRALFLGLYSWRSNVASLNALTPLFPFLMAALPLLDAILAILRWLLGRAPVQSGDPLVTFAIYWPA